MDNCYCREGHDPVLFQSIVHVRSAGKRNSKSQRESVGLCVSDVCAVKKVRHGRVVMEPILPG